MMDWLLGLAQPLVMASHSLEILEEFDEVVWLEDGLVFAQGQPSAVISAYRARYP
jgi:ABC-type polysaccharide/polyol phosphate transport system ATPase subunit